MRINTGEAFFHPVTHALILPGQVYEGAAHQEHENEVAEEQKTNLDTKEQKVKTLLKMNIADLTKALENETDLELLNPLLEKETRTGAKDVIKTKIDSLQQNP